MLLIKISSFAALGGFLFGYDLGLIGGALLEISKEFDIKENLTKEAIVGAAKFGAFFGTFLGGCCMLRYGRRKAIALNAVFFTLGPVIMALSWGSSGLVVGRLVTGLGIGASAIVVPAYLGELAPAKHRGAVVQVYEMMLCIGMLLASIVDWALQGVANDWRWMVGMPAIPGAVMGLSLVVLPESPRWLVMRNRLDEALVIIQVVLQGSNSLWGSGKKTPSTSGAGSSDANHQAPGSSPFMAEAEDELLLLWSSVEKDKFAVLERREQLMWSRRTKSLRSHEAASQQRQEAALLQPVALASASAATAHHEAPHGSELQDMGGWQERQGTRAGPGGTGVDSPRSREQGGAQHQCSHAGSHTGIPRVACTNMDEPLLLDASRQASEDGSISRISPSLSPSLPRSRRESPADDGEPGVPWQGVGVGAPLPPSAAARQAGPNPAAGVGRKAAAAAAEADTSMAYQQLQDIKGVSDVADAAEQQEALFNAPPSAPPTAPTMSTAMPGEERTVFHTLRHMLSDVYVVARGAEKRAFAIALWLAFFDQACASTAVINFAPTVLQQLGTITNRNAMIFTSLIGLTKTVGVAAGE